MLTSDRDDTIGVARAFLQTQSTLALATVNRAGKPQIAPLFYVSDDDLLLYWLSAATSRHSSNLKHKPDAAATVYPKVWAWMDIRGLQLEGSVDVVSDESARRDILAQYRQKFDLPPAFDEPIAASSLYRLRPAWLRWLDNGVGFGYKAEVRLGDV